MVEVIGKILQMCAIRRMDIYGQNIYKKIEFPFHARELFFFFFLFFLCVCVRKYLNIANSFFIQIREIIEVFHGWLTFSIDVLRTMTNYLIVLVHVI